MGTAEDADLPLQEIVTSHDLLTRLPAAGPVPGTDFFSPFVSR